MSSNPSHHSLVETLSVGALKLAQKSKKSIARNEISPPHYEYIDKTPEEPAECENSSPLV
jgi:hypothetical protein